MMMMMMMVMMMMMMMVMIMINCFCGIVERRVFCLISSQEHCQISSPSLITDTLRAGFESPR